MGSHFECNGRSVPDGYLYHVVGVDSECQPPKLLVKPGAPPSWKSTNIGFFVGRHVAKHIPLVPQYACAAPGTGRKNSTTTAAAADNLIQVATRLPAKSAWVWPAHMVDFAPCAAASSSARAPLLSELYASTVAVGAAFIVQLVNLARSEGKNFALLDDLQKSGDFVLDAFIDGVHGGDSFGAPPTGAAGVALDLEPGIAAPLLLATHCLILDRDVAFAAPTSGSPVRLVDSIPPVICQDGMPDVETLRRWASITQRRCEDFHEPILSWCISSIQFGSSVPAGRGSSSSRPPPTQRRLLDLVANQVRVEKNRSSSVHDAWLEWAFRVLSLPFVAVLLKHRRICVAAGELPLADLPSPGKAHQRPVLVLHQAAPATMFNLAAVVYANISCALLEPAVRSLGAAHAATRRLGVQEVALCKRMMQCWYVLASAVFYHPAQLRRGIRCSHILHLDSMWCAEDRQLRSVIASMCKPNAKWDAAATAIQSHRAAITARGNALRTKCTTMPNPDRALSTLVRFASEPNEATLVNIAEFSLTLRRNSLPGIITSTPNPERELVACGVALRQLCFAYNLVPPHELPTKNLRHSDRSPLPIATTAAAAPLHMAVGHDVFAQLTDYELFGVPASLVAPPNPPCAPMELPPNVVVQTGVVWAHPSAHAPRVLDLIRRATASLASHESHLAVVLGGNECPFGFVRAILAHSDTGMRLQLPDDMDCSAQAPAISVPAGVWSSCAVDVFAFNNQRAIRNVRGTDNVLVLNALQVLPCVLEHFLVPGTVAHCLLALGASPPTEVRLRPLSPLMTTLTQLAASSAANADVDSTAQQQQQEEEEEALSPPLDVAALRERRHLPLVSRKVTAEDVIASLPGTLFTRSASRLASVIHTTTTAAAAAAAVPKPATSMLPGSGRPTATRAFADLTFLPRVAHLCTRNPDHQCNVVLLHPLATADIFAWVDSAWRCPTTAAIAAAVIGDSGCTNTIECVLSHSPSSPSSSSSSSSPIVIETLSAAAAATTPIATTTVITATAPAAATTTTPPPPSRNPMS